MRGETLKRSERVARREKPSSRGGFKIKLNSNARRRLFLVDDIRALIRWNRAITLVYSSGPKADT